ncbi:hypothetical protein WOLCODRAFT_138959 [Wolfiporia cocos MD-104 SS10]|uniref:EF-hand domain-containing protein n=1 Tax=Wolfiporia cocos (strain MD-104) TaxID=742152 RepID=A0A2H3K5N1_WOLCO|nr:hypothetical protein WOLCODRAFT_138959 [Wolfiporia cocos MD-104 SS10]
MPSQPGGFLLDEPQSRGSHLSDPQPVGFIIDEPQAGGFLMNDDAQSTSSDYAERDGNTRAYTEHSQIPLFLIPTALQLLDLQPDDEDVLEVFRNAASGWENNNHRTDSEHALEQFVSRKDWRAVCAALLDSGRETEDVPSEEESEDEYNLNDEDNSNPEDVYVHSESEGAESASSFGGSDDEYRDSGYTPKAKAKARGKDKNAAQLAQKRTSRRASRRSPLSDSDEPHEPRRLTVRQKQECRRMFSLFFPTVGDADLDAQRIMIKDITRVAKLLQEKITAEEIMEMLEVFSTSPDKSMSLSDFERMMITAKLA